MFFFLGGGGGGGGREVPELSYFFACKSAIFVECFSSYFFLQYLL